MPGAAYASTTGNNLGGKFAIRETISSRNVTSLMVTATGTANMQTALKNVKLFYDLDVTYPYDCVSETYVGGESQFGSTATTFSSTSTVTFTGSIGISTTSTMCAYVITDIASGTRSSSTRTAKSTRR